MIPKFFKRKQQQASVNTFEQECEAAFNKMISEFDIGDTCFCNGCDILSGTFMHADEGVIRSFHEASLHCNVYLTEKKETVRVLPELIFHTKEEALQERELHKIERKKKDAERISQLRGTTISKYVDQYGLRPAIASFIDSSIDLRVYDYYAVEVFFGNRNHFVRTSFVAPNLTKKNNLKEFQAQFETYCSEHGYPSDCILSLSILDVSNNLEELQELIAYENSEQNNKEKLEEEREI